MALEIINRFISLRSNPFRRITFAAASSYMETQRKLMQDVMREKRKDANPDPDTLARQETIIRKKYFSRIAQIKLHNRFPDLPMNELGIVMQRAFHTYKHLPIYEHIPSLLIHEIGDAQKNYKREYLHSEEIQVFPE